MSVRLCFECSVVATCFVVLCVECLWLVVCVF